MTLPAFVGVLSSPSSEPLFAVKWKTAGGGLLQSWLRIGQQAGDFKLVGFDASSDQLAIEDSSGRRFRLVLPDGKVQGQLTDQEFTELMEFMLSGADTTNAPELSRDRARAFFLRMIQTFTPAKGTEVVLDLAGTTVPFARRATWELDQARARTFDRLLLAATVDGKPRIAEFPRKPFNAPDQMSRNLTDADWDELALLQAVASLKGGRRPDRK